MKNENTELTQDWDKIFPKSTKVNHTKVTFINRFGITIVADLYETAAYNWGEITSACS
ncbi:Uncharacterized conserved protein [Staphylococcus gallinarum]|uniref:Uncharacterized conserved protein n=1 Tax=Staphylococcus gallinarum TaxID=1293 RepID=A0A380FAT8_STAGA|nr:Uncharacterized conserved protein [Staphylococcus gallinarum]